MRNKSDSIKIVNILKEHYPESPCNLSFEQAWQLLVAVRLSAQCTDARVNKITPILFEKYPSLYHLSAASPEEIEAIIRPCGLGKSKARDIHAAAIYVTDKLDNKLPNSMDELLKIPGVGRKSANLILGDIFNVPGVVIADTHCIRIANRLGFASSKDPVKVENALRKVLPAKESNGFCHRCVQHGRIICTARKAKCDECVLSAFCPIGSSAI